MGRKLVPSGRRGRGDGGSSEGPEARDGSTRTEANHPDLIRSS